MSISRRAHTPRRAAAVLLVLFSGIAASQGQNQQPAQSPLYGGNRSAEPAQQGGSATGGVFAPVLDAEKRPITAGGFVKEGEIVFKDISEPAGISSWKHTMGTPQKKYILETIGSGVALLDYDRDGWLDIHIVNGSAYDYFAIEEEKGIVQSVYDGIAAKQPLQRAAAESKTQSKN